MLLHGNLLSDATVAAQLERVRAQRLAKQQSVPIPGVRTDDAQTAVANLMPTEIAQPTIDPSLAKPIEEPLLGLNSSVQDAVTAAVQAAKNRETEAAQAKVDGPPPAAPLMPSIPQMKQSVPEVSDVSPLLNVLGAAKAEGERTMEPAQRAARQHRK